MPRPEKLAALFDEAMALRDLGRLEEAIDLLRTLVACTEPEPDVKLHAHSLNQIARMYFRTGDFKHSELESMKALAIAPRFELASLGLFHSLLRQDRWIAAFEEAVRFVSLKHSVEYRSLFFDDGFLEGLFDPELRGLALTVRAKLDRWS